MKKLGIRGVLGLLLELIAAASLALSIFTDINDDLFLPLALCCTCVASCISLSIQIQDRKNKKK